MKNELTNTLDLLHESRGVRQFKVENASEEVKPQTKSPPSIAISTRKDAKPLQATETVFDPYAN